MIGRHVQKKFKTTDNDDDDDDGDFFEGEVISYDKPYWQICYFADGDEEDMTLGKILEHLV